MKIYGIAEIARALDADPGWSASGANDASFRLLMLSSLSGRSGSLRRSSRCWRQGVQSINRLASG